MLQNHEYGGYGDEPRRKREDNNKPNHVLLFTIINPVYPITVRYVGDGGDSGGDGGHGGGYGGNGGDDESATRAKETLHGADIYSGCCTLKIDFAKQLAAAAAAAAIATSVVFPVGAYAKRAELFEVPRLDVMLGKTHFGMALFIGSVNVRGGTN
ncbi:hypothetical protein HZH68_013253 [Vespula germanica]|uniref:Uncharacterized protein n=1 Tax=Vespula germanica TaxID=30212 RepID=A0A834JCT7_VESGE|nr:hypothetical protein HZH68_013253 [Vespula germanica]